MIRICLITPGHLPVPAVKGGAIEELVTILINENERNPLVHFIVCSSYDEKAKRQSITYSHTTFIYIKKANHIKEIMYWGKKVIRKFLHYETLICDAYYGEILKKLRKHKVDYLVAEGGNYREFKGFLKIVKRENMFLHIHHHYQASQMIEHVFGNIIAVSDFVKNEWNASIKVNNQHQYVVYNCVNEDKFNKTIRAEERIRLRKQLGFAAEDFIILYCGRIVPVKGVKELIAAVIGLQQETVKLMIIGSVEHASDGNQQYLREIRQLAVSNHDNIKVTGYINNKRLYQYYQCADLQVVPSLWEEAAGLVTIEGMLSGLPLIVTNSGGMPEYTKDAAIVVQKEEQLIAQLQYHIQKIKDNKELREQLRSQSRMQSEKFRKAEFLVKFVECFKTHEGGKRNENRNPDIS